MKVRKMTENGYKYLDRWRGSNYRQLFYKERKIRAETLCRATLDPEARTAEQVAQDFEVPVEAVHEACLEEFPEGRLGDWPCLPSLASLPHSVRNDTRWDGKAPLVGIPYASELLRTR